LSLVLPIIVMLAAWCADVRAALHVSPPAIGLCGPESSQQVLAFDMASTGRAIDVTRGVTFELADPGIASIDARGLVFPKRDGATELVVRHGADAVRVPVEVKQFAQPAPISFEHEVMPLLTKLGCNSGGCHGKAEGQNGFKLSVFGFDPRADYDAIVKEARGRRVFLAAPDRSMLLLKATSTLPHGGGRKIEWGSRSFQLLRRWIAEGAEFRGSESGEVASIEVEPAEQVIAAGGSQQLRVTAVDSDGTRRCVTAETDYASNAESIAGCDPRGLVQAGIVPGEAAILVRYMGKVAVSRMTLPREGVTFVRPREANFIDRHVWNKLDRLGIVPSEPAGDAMFLRRVYLDTIGTLPTADEARQFLSDKDPQRRARLIDRLLERDEYADFWTLRWGDILRIDQNKIKPQGAVAMTRWLRRRIRENAPYDRLVYEILTARGNTASEGPAAFYKAVTGPEALGRSISQLFLGVRIECAQCHHHPSEKWGQEDYFALAGFFTGMATKPAADGNEVIFWRGGADLRHPRTGKLVPAHALGAAAKEFAPGEDRRKALAEWMVAPDNPFFARAVANRLWAHYFGRGLVTPLDDMRATNPASNEPLLSELAQHLQDVKFDLKAFTRTLLNSAAYQLSSKTNASNASDEQNFSHAAEKPLPAEVLLDAICQASGVAEKFNGWPDGYRAIQVWDSSMPSYFFRIFGRPTRVSVCECERSNEPSIAQALHLMNSPEIMEKIQSPEGRARRLADSPRPPAEILDELYLAVLSRTPSAAEARQMSEAFDGRENRRDAVEDVMWALINSREFLSNQ